MDYFNFNLAGEQYSLSTTSEFYHLEAAGHTVVAGGSPTTVVLDGSTVLDLGQTYIEAQALVHGLVG